MSLYEQWLEASDALKKAKAYELELRNAICEMTPSDKLEGTSTFISEEFKISVTHKLNRTIDREVLESIYEDLTDQEKECIDYKPSLKLAAYKKVEQTGGKLLEAVTVKPAQASLKISYIGEE